MRPLGAFWVGTVAWMKGDRSYRTERRMGLGVEEGSHTMELFRALVRASGLEPRLVSGLMGYPYHRFSAMLRGELPVTDEFIQRAEEVLGVPEAIFAGEEGRTPVSIQ